MNAKTQDPKAAAGRKGRAQKTPRGERPPAPMPPAGPHAEPHLVNPDATPGTGSLPAADHDEAGTDPGGG
ncbi:MAG: hypothetical protein NVSMB26_07960 [Beijerinckiaceae bacterium]